MGLAATIEKGAPPDPRTKCAVATWAGSLTDDDRAALERVTPLAVEHAEGWTISSLWRMCVGEGLTVQRDKFAKHIHGECSCGTR